MKLTFDDKGGFYVDEDKVDEDGLHPEVLLPDDVNQEIERLRLVTEGQLAQIERLRTSNKHYWGQITKLCAVVDAARRCPIRREHEELYQALRELEEG